MCVSSESKSIEHPLRSFGSSLLCTCSEHWPRDEKCVPGLDSRDRERVGLREDESLLSHVAAVLSSSRGRVCLKVEVSDVNQSLHLGESSLPLSHS
eukprot:1970610-Amphidinium_carterae.1